MGNTQVPGLNGIDAFERSAPDPFPVTGGGATPPLTGIELKAGDRIITKVTRDWDAANPALSTSAEVHGKNSLEVGKALMALPGEWGQGGGSILNDAVPDGTSAEVTVTLHGGLFKKMPKWAEYSQASTAAKKNWDDMFAKLEIHESKHVQNAAEAAEKCATDLMGKEILQMPGIVTRANAAMAAAQKKLDDATDHGAKENVPFGDVIMNTDD